MRSVARRHRVLSEEIAELDARIERIVEEAAPQLVALDGVGPDTAAALLIAAGDNPERLKSEASFAHLCAGRRPCPPPQAGSFATGSTPAETGTPTARAARGGAQPPEARRSHANLRRQEDGRGQVQEGGHAVPETLHRPRDLPRHPPGRR